MWRGIAFDNSPEIQAWGLIAYKNFAIGAWGGVNFTGNYYEPDLFLSYNIKSLTLTITDVDAGFGNQFFNYKSDETNHIIDASFAYVLSEKFPLQVSAAVILYGFDKKVIDIDAAGNYILDTKDNYSGYIELNYPLTLAGGSIDFTLGTVTHKSFIYGTTGAAVINAGIKFSKEIEINEKFSLPLSLAFIINPDKNTVNTVLKISL